jgi:hypothetical protein
MVSVRRTPLPIGRHRLHSGLMTETIAEESVASKNDQWRERIAEHERSGMSVKKFCKERGIREHLFFYWRKRLRNQQQRYGLRWWRRERCGRHRRRRQIWNWCWRPASDCVSVPG